MKGAASSLWMLDTNMVSHILKGHPRALARLAATPMTAVCISAITEGELRFGLAKRPQAVKLHHIVHEFLQRVESRPWDAAVAAVYGRLRAALEAGGKGVGALDLLIAAHALALDCVLVTNDVGFGQVGPLKTEDWTKEAVA